MAGPTKKERRKAIEDDLRNQLLRFGKIGKFYDDLINDYMSLYDLKLKCNADIKKHGLRIKSVNGNGIECEKDNASIGNLLKVNSQMLKILSDLDLTEPSLPLSASPKEKRPMKDDLLSRN